MGSLCLAFASLLIVESYTLKRFQPIVLFLNINCRICNDFAHLAVESFALSFVHLAFMDLMAMWSYMRGGILSIFSMCAFLKLV
jgi:hypothetical protein